jgi:predicted alpha-1,2-mannosidase
MTTESAAAEGKSEAAARRSPRWKRVLRCFLLISLAVLLAGAGFIGALFLKYKLIVGTHPGQLKTKVQPGELGRLVNPFSGTGGFPWVCGNNSPAAMVPFGMVRVGPETESMLIHKRALNTSGYYYGDDQVLGFSHTRLMGTGATDGGHFLVTPMLEPVDAGRLRTGAKTRFSHSEEVAFPGYYAVRLPERGVLVELTATPRVGVHRYTFSGSGTAHLWIDVSNALGGRRSTEGKVLVKPQAREVEGQIRTFGTFASRYGGLKVYFAARFDRPFASFSTWQGAAISAGQPSAEGDRVGVDLAFAPSQYLQEVTLRLAISYVSVENARANLQAEAGKPFDEVAAEAQRLWAERLSLIRVQGSSEQQRRVFYTAFYRVFQMPTLFNDANGDYVGFDKKVHRATGFQYFTDLSLWDTFRTVHPLYTLLVPKEQRDMMVSLTKMLEQGGWLPRWPSGHGYSNSMLGTPADIVMAEAYLKGIRDFDIEAAYGAMRRTALGPVPPGAAFSGRQGVEHYLKYGYCPRGLVDKSVARTFEFGWADRAISLLAEALGHTNDTELFRKHSEFYRNLWNPQTQYFQPRPRRGNSTSRSSRCS